ncbi:MAG: hypothetical protein IMW96_06455 [Thermoanaerobacteraceae bacterium]|uniref:hypothetical protein n=1 Tax=Thermanaeromonas sp. C210 TaxID=2731925 RepID=UPI0015638CD4|nr:hypothetical protein [Thermanaeromonas sp. C210]MBE3581262.1 hypothetical protein [Thermoanaerobacteraceae bacterium]
MAEICVGIIAAAVATAFGKVEALDSNQEWLCFLASYGAVLLTFLAGAELERDVMRKSLSLFRREPHHRVC